MIRCMNSPCGRMIAMGKYLKILFVNIYLFILLLMTTNLFSGLFLILYPQISSFFTANYDGTRGFNRWRLPNYKDKNRAQQIFREANTLKLVYSPFVGFRYSAFRGRTITLDKFGDRIHVPAEPLSPAAPDATAETCSAAGGKMAFPGGGPYTPIHGQIRPTFDPLGLTQKLDGLADYWYADDAPKR